MAVRLENRQQILAALQRNLAEIRTRFGVAELSLFGSAARDELDDDSDVDVLAAFEDAATFDGYFDLKFYLEALFGRPVDLATPRGLKPRLRPHIEAERLRVA